LQNPWWDEPMHMMRWKLLRGESGESTWIICHLLWAWPWMAFIESWRLMAQIRPDENMKS
jgi:hypothetical protein